MEILIGRPLRLSAGGGAGRRADGASRRVVIVVGKPISQSAAVRNRIRRRIRAAVRAASARTGEPLALIAKKEIRNAQFRDIIEATRRALR